MDEHQEKETSESKDDLILERMRTIVLVKADEGLYEARDVGRVKENKWFLKRFLLDKNGDFAAAVDALDACLRWRKHCGINDMRPDEFPKEFYEMGVLYIGKDKEGREVLYIRLVLNRVIGELHESNKKLITLIIDTLDREANEKQFGIVFDLKGTGTSNVDLSLVKSLLNTVFSYYPLSLAYVCLFEPPWLAKPIIALILALVPTKYKKLIMTCDQKSLSAIVGEDFLATWMGGKGWVSMEKMKPMNPVSFQDVAVSLGWSQSARQTFLQVYAQNMTILQKEADD